MVTLRRKLLERGENLFQFQNLQLDSSGRVNAAVVVLLDVVVVVVMLIGSSGPNVIYSRGR
jgi:hypothetical protein